MHNAHLVWKVPRFYGKTGELVFKGVDMEDNPFRYFTAIFALEEQLKPLAGIEKIFSGFAAGIRELAAACASLRDALAGFLDGDLPENLKILEKTEKTLAPPTNPAYCPFAPDIAMAKAPEPLLMAGALEPQTQAMPPEPLSRASAALPNLPRLASANPQKQQTPETGNEPLPVVSLLEPLRQIVPQALGIFPGLGDAPKISGQILDVAIKAAKLPEIFGKKHDAAPLATGNASVAELPRTPPFAAPSNTLKGPAKDIGDIIKVFVGRGAGRENFLQKVTLPPMPSFPPAPEIPEISVPEPVLPDPPEAPEHIARIAEAARGMGPNAQGLPEQKTFNISSATFILKDVKDPQDLMSQFQSALSEFGEAQA